MLFVAIDSMKQTRLNRTAVNYKYLDIMKEWNTKELANISELIARITTVSLLPMYELLLS